jgi:hypothetical protein
MFVIWGPEAATGERGADFEIPTQLLAAACFSAAPATVFDAGCQTSRLLSPAAGGARRSGVAT